MCGRKCNYDVIIHACSASRHARNYAMTVIATLSTESTKIPDNSAEEQTAEIKDASVLPNSVVSTSDCYATLHSVSGSIDSTARTATVSASNDSTIVCRICQDPDSPHELTTLCRCTGSIAKYHVTCLEQWLSVAKTDVCEICHGRFKTKRKPRPFSEWIRCLRNTSQCRYIYGDLLCLLVLTPLAMTSAALCGEGSWYYVSIGQVLIGIGLVALCTFLVLLYIVWFVLSVRYHLNMWYKWRAENQEVKIIISEKHRLCNQKSKIFVEETVV